eukprot:g3979.t1
MVRIINGEIVSDNDPRVVGAQRRSSAGSGDGGTQGKGYGRVASLLDPPSTSTTASGGGASGGQGTGGRGGGRGGDGGGGGGGPLDQLAEMIGVGGRFVKIPGALGVQENEVPLIYLMIAALVVLFGGWKIAAMIVFAYVITNQKGRAR